MTAGATCANACICRTTSPSCCRSRLACSRVSKVLTVIPVPPSRSIPAWICWNPGCRRSASMTPRCSRTYSSAFAGSKVVWVTRRYGITGPLSPGGPIALPHRLLHVGRLHRPVDRLPGCVVRGDALAPHLLEVGVVQPALRGLGRFPEGGDGHAPLGLEDGDVAHVPGLLPDEGAPVSARLLDRGLIGIGFHRDVIDTREHHLPPSDM